MASVIFNSLMRDVLLGAVSFGGDSFKALLVTSAYVPDKDAHAKRSDLTGEVSGAGYTAGGVAVTPTVSAVDTANDWVEVSFSGPSWPAATITARGAVIYKSRGGAASADELVAYVDFGSDVSSTGATFSVDFTGPLRFQN